MARRSQCSSAGDNPLDPNYLPPHYREEYRLAIDALIEADLEGYYGLLQEANVVDFLSQSEIEYIKCMVQIPRQSLQPDRRYMVGEGDGSSDTYWPTQSDLDAPVLDLGWPHPQRFVEPTEITTLVNPSEPDMPSIKEHVRRMIRNAQQVVAVVMDMFSDVDIFAEILNAAMRKVAVYVLLDEMNSHHFVAMANNCKVNLDEIKFMRVRTVPGSTYLCHTGKSFKGQMMNRFMLVDCRVALSGNYSFMWSFEKIHRCMAHVFLGQLVTTFDEEFRILYAQSEPLVVQNPMTYVEDFGNFPGRQYDHKYKRDYPPMQNIRPEWHGHSFEENIVVDPSLLPFRKVGSISSSADEHLAPQIHNTQHFRGESSFLEQRNLLKGPNAKEISGIRRHGYTEKPSLSYLYPPYNAGNRGKQHLEDMEIQRAQFPREQYFNQRMAPDPAYEMYGKPRDHGYYQQVDMFAEPSYPHEMEVNPSSDYDHVQRYLQSHSTMDTGPTGQLLLPVQSNPRRHSIGQTYACQISPTQPNLPEQKYLFNVHNKRQEQKEGLRDWRISSYLTALQPTGEEDMAHLQRTDSSENLSYIKKGRSYEPEISETRPDKSESSKMPTSRLNPFSVQNLNSLALPDKIVDRTFIKNTKPNQQTTSEPAPSPTPEPTPSAASAPTPPVSLELTPATTSESSRTTESEKADDIQNKETKESNLIREEFVRKRPSLAIQRNSRLRHSLIFNSNLEQHATDETNNSSLKDADDPLRPSPFVSNILDKKRHVTKEPFQWINPVKSFDAPDLKSEVNQTKSEVNSESKDKTSHIVKNDADEKSIISQSAQPKDVRTESSHIPQAPFPGLQRSASFIDMDDPESRLRFFKELAAKRKAEALAKQSVTKETEKPQKPLSKDTVKEKEPAFSNTAKNSHAAEDNHPPGLLVEDSQASGDKQQGNLHGKNIKHKLLPDLITTEKSALEGESSHIPTAATDSEKIKLKKKLSEEHDSSSNAMQEQNTPPENTILQLSTKPNISCTSISKDSSPEVLSAHISGPSKHLSTGASKYSTSLDKSKAEHTVLTHKYSATHPDQHSSDTSETRQSFSSKVIDPLRHSPQSEIKPARQPTALKTDIPQRLTVEEIQPLQQASTALAGVTQQSSLAKTDTLQHSSATDSCSFQCNIKTEADPSHYSIAPKTVIRQNSSEAETCPVQLSISTETSLSQQNTAAKIDKLQHTTAAETNLSKQTMQAGIITPQHSTPTKKETAEIPLTTAAKLDTQHPTTEETGLSQQPSISLTPQPSTAAKAETYEPHSTEEPDPPQHPVANVDALQNQHSTESGPVLHTTTAESSLLQQKAETHNIPITTATLPSQDSTAAKTDPLQQPTSSETDHFQHPTTSVTPQSSAIKTETHQLSITADPVHYPVAANVETLQNPFAKETKSLHHTTAETCLQQQTTESNADSLPIKIETTPSHDSVAATMDTIQYPTEKVPFQQLTTEKTIPPQSLTATKIETHELPITTESGPSQHLVAENVNTLQNPSATEPEPFDNTTTAETSLPQLSSETKTETHNAPIAAEPTPLQDSRAATIDTLQQPTVAETLLFLEPTTEKTIPPQQSAATKTETPGLPSTTDPGPFQHPGAKTVDKIQNPSATETEPLHHTTPAETSLPQLSSARKTETHNAPIISETIPSQDPTAAKLDSLPQPTVEETGSVHQNALADSSPPQRSPEMKTETPQFFIKAEIHSLQHPADTVMDTIQRPTATETGPLQDPTTVETTPPQQTTVAESECTQLSSTAKSGFSQDPEVAKQDTQWTTTAIETDLSIVTDTGPCHHPTAEVPQHHKATKTDPSQPCSPTKPDIPQHPSSKETGSSLDLTTLPDTSHHSISTDTGLLQEPTTLTDPSQNPKAIQPDSSTASATQTQSALSIAEEMSNTAPISDAAASTSSSTVSTKDADTCIIATNPATTEPKDIPSPKITLPINVSAVQSGTSQAENSATEVSPKVLSDDQKSQNTASNTSSLPEAGKRTSESYENITPNADSSPLVFDKELEKADSSNNTVQSSVMGPKETNSQESCLNTTIAETPENSALVGTSSSTEHSNREESSLKEKDLGNKQSSLTAKSSLQSSTANVISCSNLRDDTKVLLEQISAKNQGRASKLTSGDANEDGTDGSTKPDKHISGSRSNTQTWSSQASTEDRENLLKKIENMRKERRVYSRFEAS